MSEDSHGTSGGVELTDESVEELADQAEEGYDPAQLQRRSRRGRPPLGQSAASVFHVRLPPALRDALEQAADARQTTPSEIVRQALHQFLSPSSGSTREAS